MNIIGIIFNSEINIETALFRQLPGHVDLLFAAIPGPGCLRKAPGYIVIAVRETRQLAQPEVLHLLYSVVIHYSV